MCAVAVIIMFEIVGLILAWFIWQEADKIEVDPRVRDNKRRIRANTRRIAEHDRRLTKLERQVAAWKERDDVV